jgi:tetratricopeptide (TPR) repeat protein
MDLTVQILAKNQQNLIIPTIQSIQNLNCQIILNDLGSQDKTVELAETMGVNILHHTSNDRSEIRNRIIKEANTKFHMYLDPGEVLIQGLREIIQFKENAAYLSIITNGTLCKEIRLWNVENKFKFKNPIFEYLDCKTDIYLNTFIKGCVNNDSNQLEILQNWRMSQPTNPSPYYYESLYMLSIGDLDGFMNMSQHYMFIEKNKTSVSATMNRYYYALAHLHKGKVRPTLQNINLCICIQPTMAEFWCLIGDVYYYLIKDFDKAIAFYENAIILGSRRKKNDIWPMDIAKYKEYPNSMIDSCKKIKESFGIYLKNNI